MNHYASDDTFDDLARRYAVGISRRSLLQLILGMFMFGFKWSQTRNAIAAEAEVSSIYLPIVMQPGQGCTQASTCPEKVFCSKKPECICIKSAEGEIHCGRTPICESPRCQVSADCTFMGSGYFCDVPFSGCCDKPPNHLQRCIKPCALACPARRDCPTSCCHTTTVCINGRCQSCDLDRICGDMCCPKGQWCLGGECVADTTGCPECGTCYRCFSDGKCFAGHCPGGCVQGALCRMATLYPEHQKLASYLTAQGFAPTGERHAASLVVAHTNEYIRDVYTAAYENADNGATATLHLIMEVTGAIGSYILVKPTTGTIYGLWIALDGTVVRADPPAQRNSGWLSDADPTLAPSNAVVINAGPTISADGYNMSTTGLCRECLFVCTAAVAIGCAAAAALLCGPVAVKCAAVAAGVCSATEGVPCNDYCKSVLAPQLESDVENCGSCGNTCQSPNNQCCKGKCSDRLKDSSNCGGCGKACAAGQVCCDGRCEAPDECCPYPKTPCQGYCCPEPICAPEGGCCPPLRLCSGGLACCDQGQQCITRGDGSSFCCAATQACPKFLGGPVEQCCPEGTGCTCGLSGCTCR
jgi:hypothetical protein